MISRSVVLFRRGKIAAAVGEQKPDELFAALSEEGVKELKKQARDHLKHLDISKIIIPAGDAYRDTMRCLLCHGEIAWIREISENRDFGPTKENFQMWADLINAAQAKAANKDGRFGPEHILAVNKKLVLETGQKLFGHIRESIENIKHKNCVLIVSERGFIESILCFLAKEGGFIGLNRTLEEGEALTFMFKGKELEAVNFLAHPEKVPPEIEELDRAILNFAKRPR